MAVFLGLLLPLLGVELYLRATGFNPYERLLDGKELLLRKSEHAEVLYELVPGAAGSVWGTSVQINSLGLRDREYSPKKPPGVYRILALGDSITFGNYVAAREPYPEQLEGMLGRLPGRFEVLNLGLGGYDTLNEVALLEHKGLALQPDMVVVGFCINDAGTVSVNLKAVLQLSEWGALYRLRLFQFVKKRLESRALAQDMLRLPDEDAFRQSNEGLIEEIGPDPELEQQQRRLAKHLEARYEPMDPHRRFLSWYTSAARIGKLRHAFGRLRRLQEAHRFGVLVVFIPGVDTAEHREAYQLVRDIVRHEVARRGLGFTDVLEEFAASEGGKLGAGPKDFIHPNREGHRIVAEAVFRVLARNRGEFLSSLGGP